LGLNQHAQLSDESKLKRVSTNNHIGHPWRCELKNQNQNQKCWEINIYFSVHEDAAGTDSTWAGAM
jgi:hypothetical protein